MALIAVLYIAYSASRLLANDDFAAASQRAIDILHIERLLHLNIESWLNQALAPIMQIAVPMSLWYATLHYIVTPSVLGFLFLRRREFYSRARNALVIGSAIGLVTYVLLPTAPPRLMPGGYYIDVLAETSSYGWWSAHASAPSGLGHLTNELAAMPSLHVGWTVWVAWALWRHVGTIRRAVACLYVVGTAFVVVATGNHWVLDAIAGAAVVTIGIMASGLIERGQLSRSKART